jgi:hypothetical protein
MSGRQSQPSRLALSDAQWRASRIARGAVRPSQAPPEHWSCCGRFRFDDKQVHLRQVRRLSEIIPFYDAGTTMRLLIPVVTASFDVSLRLLDYCCTNYAKKTRVVICAPGLTIHLFSLYKDWLRHYRRRGFDPFRRRERILFEDPRAPGEWLDTTVAQLNFLRWADIYGVIDYVRANLQTIEEDMMQTLGDSKRRRGSKEPQGDATVKRRRTELSRAPRNECTVYMVSQSLLFQE